MEKTCELYNRHSCVLPPLLLLAYFEMILRYHTCATLLSSIQVFDIVLNGLVAVPSLDIFSKVGKAAAHDEIVPFSVGNGQLHVSGESSDFGGTLSVEFAKVSNPPSFGFSL